MIHAVLSIDSAFAPWAATTIRSLLDAEPGPELTLHILCDATLAANDRERLASMCAGSHATIEFRPVDETRLANLPPIGRAGRIVWWRLLLPDLFADLDRAVFLDGDTFVVRDVEALWETDLAGSCLGAVANVVHPELHTYVRRLGCDPKRYLNAGIIVFDLARMRGERSSDRLIATAEELRDRSMWADQDALNVVFAGRWHTLHPRFNAMNSLWAWRSWADDLFGPAAEEARSDPAVLHFEGPSVNKPWHYLNAHPWRERYRTTLARTPWAGVPLEDVGVVNRAIRLLPSKWWTQLYVRTKRLRQR